MAKKAEVAAGVHSMQKTRILVDARSFVLVRLLNHFFR